MSKVYLLNSKRTAIASFLGSLKTLHPADFAALVVKDLLEESKLAKELVDEVIVGNILPAGLGQGLGRQVAIKAGLPQEITAHSLNMACGSGMKAIMNAVNSIKAGYSNCIIAGGTESMSSSPYLLPKAAREGIKMGDFKVQDHMIFDALTDAFSGIHMGITAENIAKKHQIGRAAQDEFAFNSQQKALAAIDSDRFASEIVPVRVKTRKAEFVFKQDEYPNPQTNLEKLASLRSVFLKDGTVTAGNASGLNDGASFSIIVGEEFVQAHNLEPLAEIISFAEAGVDPDYMGLGPVPAITKVLAKSGLSLEDIDLIELNEAFAAQSLGVIIELADLLGLKQSDILQKTNVNGGAIALGHPVGASGNRIVTTLVHELRRRAAQYGLASLCIGGGMGTAIIVKNLGGR